VAWCHPGPEQESGTGWSLPANVCGGFIPYLIWEQNYGKRVVLVFYEVIKNKIRKKHTNII